MKKFGHKIKIFYLNCIHRNSDTVMKLLRNSENDFEIRRAATVNEFIRQIAEYNADVVIADHNIQSVCLSEALETLKQNGQNIPVILITNFESEDLAKILVRTGVTDYVFIERPERLPFALTQSVELYRLVNHSRSQAEQSRKEFSDLVENLPVGLTIWNKQRQLVYFNQSMNDFSFQSDDGLYQRWRKITIDLYDTDNRQISLDQDVLALCLTEGKNITREDLHILKADGSKRYVTVVASPSGITAGLPTGVTLLFFDTTAQKLAQLKSNTLGELLQAKNNELGQFAHIISHNLRDPIAKILGLASIWDASDDSGFIMNKITEEANKLDSMVKDLNVLVSVRNVEREKKESLAFEHEFSLVSQVLKREIQDSKAMIETDFADQHEIFTVKSYLYSVIYNLLSNSIKYRDINKPLSIRMRTYKIGQYACLSVKDNGLGIDLNKNRDKIFGLYKRFHSEHIPGKGVGLHFIKTYAEALGGKVEIDSQLHEGTELKVYFLNQNHE